MDRRMFLKIIGISAFIIPLLSDHSNDNRLEELPLREFLKRKCDCTLKYPTSKQTALIPDRGRKSGTPIGSYTDIDAFEVVYNTFIKGKPYLPADEFGKSFGFIVDFNGEADFCSIDYGSVVEFLS